MKFTNAVKHNIKNKLKHQTTKASLLDLEALEGAEYYRKLAEWLDRASRVLFPEIIPLYSKQPKAGSCPLTLYSI
ncbi:Oidioi.mRNA.OKI2018_I69.PAR.g10328.t1.cds [Oikopleura dioica]|uniref:Oidioi.mRNA.OKI2018_I69.PAR.g10328.t1.cds n=1 Tax=Oikopleura dioica TaxID=34765 RepID=A0ABN7RT59_OIKDI|nr:Oidioi.mRNA.OKI2018_I69.PAR.g10328.t1.cds [Oikopleura dioica]